MYPREQTLGLGELTNDREARFEMFVEAHRAWAVRVAWRLLGAHRDAAEDVAQDAFLKAYKSLHRFRDESSLKTWFYRILIRQVSNHRRWHGVRDKWRSLWGNGLDSGVSGLESIPDPGLQQRIALALDALSSGQREAFVLVRLEGLSVREAAAVMECAPGTVKSHLHRASVTLRASLQDLVEPHLEGDHGA